MELDRLSVALRARTPWEAMDLGLSMARVWARPLWVGWIATVLLPAAAIWLILWRHPLWALLVCWWLRPVWDHAPLHVVSRALFGGETDLRGTVRAAAAHALRDAPGKLLWRRLAPWRTLVAPVTQLEGLRGAAARRRRSVLGRGLGTHALWLTVLGGLMEAVVAMGIVGAVMMTLPDEPRFALDVLTDQLIDGDAPLWLRLLVPAVSLSAMTLVEPLVVAAGFGLYINRRTLLEGWDVELVFRRLAARLRPVAKAVSALILTVGLAGVAIRPALADPAPDDAAVEAAVEAVLDDPVFGEPRTETRWELRDYDFWDWFQFDRDSEAASSGLPGVGAVLEVALWVLVGALLVGAVLAVVTRFGGDGAGPTGRRVALGALSGAAGAAPPPASPDDPPSLARALWAEGRRDEALAVLYGASVRWLIDEAGVEVPEGATEGEVLRMARRALPPGPLDVFRRLTLAWQQVAYAHRPLGAADFEGLCAAWPQLRAGGVA